MPGGACALYAFRCVCVEYDAGMPHKTTGVQAEEIQRKQATFSHCLFHCINLKIRGIDCLSGQCTFCGH